MGFKGKKDFAAFVDNGLLEVLSPPEGHFLTLLPSPLTGQVPVPAEDHPVTSPC